MKKAILSLMVSCFTLLLANSQTIRSMDKMESQWNGKRIAFLGDSMTQKWQRGDQERIVFWEYLEKMMDIEPYVYGISGHQWNHLYGQVEKLINEHGIEVDAILIFAGTNDYMHNTPLGNFYRETVKSTNFNGTEVERKYRVHEMNDSTFCGRINKVMSYLKHHFPDQQIVIMTPIHRAYSTFGPTNVQPEESYANALGLYIDDYVEVLRKAASVWAVPLIDLYSVSGLYPMEESHSKYFMHAKTDLLHPGALGNWRLAKTIYYQLIQLPATFVE